MSAVNEIVVREYFEQLGYLVSQPRKYSPGGRQKTPDEELDLIVCNPQLKEHVVPSRIIWNAGDLKTVARAVVGIRGWHTERFYASTFEQMPDILRFAEGASIRFAEKLLAASPIARILCIPNLPAGGGLKEKTLQLLKEKGIDGVISFRTMLLDLVARVDTNMNYDKSDLLQTIRLLKNYDLIKESQLDMFAGKRRRKSAADAKN